jgi:hypothetical protein
VQRGAYSGPPFAASRAADCRQRLIFTEG